MPDSRPLTVLCLASYEKGQEFLRECKRQGCRVILLTSESVGKQVWPLESIDEIFLMPDEAKKWNLQHVLSGVNFLARTETIDRIVPLDDFDLETAAALREHLRVPGLGETTTRYFRDKLAMRMRAAEVGIPVPEFIHVLNYASLNEFMARVPAPWLVKPRFEASSTGIKKIESREKFWEHLESLNDKQSYYLMERFVPGGIYHVDSIVDEREIIFAEAHEYGHPPLEVAHEGGIFTTRTMQRESPDALKLKSLNAEVLSAMGLMRGVSHTEFIKGEDGQFYFLETSARAGGAHIVELIEATTGMNLWVEWARVEIARGDGSYQLPAHSDEFGGLIVSLARQEIPDTSAYQDAEIAWRLNKRYHVGLIVRSEDPARIDQLLSDYIERFYHDFHAMQPLPERPVS
ncbi:MAG TPA: ATP-grasp domain-containing protein [Pyrinomonadaceae bacterium]|nr:ATP-grasp domain-containing protein [Pyrinomonadaceae bacterium]